MPKLSYYRQEFVKWLIFLAESMTSDVGSRGGTSRRRNRKNRRAKRGGRGGGSTDEAGHEDYQQQVQRVAGASLMCDLPKKYNLPLSNI